MSPLGLGLRGASEGVGKLGQRRAPEYDSLGMVQLAAPCGQQGTCRGVYKRQGSGAAAQYQAPPMVLNAETACEMRGSRRTKVPPSYAYQAGGVCMGGVLCGSKAAA